MVWIPPFKKQSPYVVSWVLNQIISGWMMSPTSGRFSTSSRIFKPKEQRTCCVCVCVSENEAYHGISPSNPKWPFKGRTGLLEIGVALFLWKTGAQEGPALEIGVKDTSLRAWNIRSISNQQLQKLIFDYLQVTYGGFPKWGYPRMVVFNWKPYQNVWFGGTPILENRLVVTSSYTGTR